MCARRNVDAVGLVDAEGLVVWWLLCWGRRGIRSITARLSGACGSLQRTTRSCASDRTCANSSGCVAE